MHARRGLWSPSSMQELSSFHLVDPTSYGVMMIVMSKICEMLKNVWDNCVMTTLISNRNLKLCV